MFTDNGTYLATLVAFRERLETLVAASLEDLENRDAVGRLVLVQPLTRQPSSGPVSDRLLTQVRRMVEVAAGTPMLAPRYFEYLVSELMEIYYDHYAYTEAPAWKRDATLKPKEGSKKISKLPNIRANLGLWARDTVNWLWYDLVCRVHPAARVQAAIDILAAAHPDTWFWLVSDPQFDGALSYFRRALDPNRHGPISRAEMLSRIAQLLGTDPSRFGFDWWYALHGMDNRIFTAWGIEQGVLDFIWSTLLEIETNGLERPKTLPPLLTVRSFDLTKRKVEWGKGKLRGQVTLTLHLTPHEQRHCPYLPDDTVTALRSSRGSRRRIRRQFTVVQVESNFVSRGDRTVTITAQPERG